MSKPRLMLLALMGLVLLLGLGLYAFRQPVKAKIFGSSSSEGDRLATALAEKGPALKKRLKTLGLGAEKFELLLMAFKAEDELRLYARAPQDPAFKLLERYAVCAKSGDLGPKLKQGDGQVPEGFYHIERFNAQSKFYLSLGLNYPNEADRQRSRAKDLGGDIFIHGACVTVGCLPMTDDKIKEIYLYAHWAKEGGQKQIPVYVFPFEMTAAKYNRYSKQYPQWAEFWASLKPAYAFLHRDSNPKPLQFSYGAKGLYQVKTKYRAGK